MSHDLLPTLARLDRPRLLILGDLILDRYTFGNAERVSQEAPVILLRADRREARLGGAANVANMLRGLEAEAVLCGVVGDDADGREVRAMLTEAGVDVSGLLADPARPTTVKERFIGRAANRHPHQILRVDSEVRDALSPELEQQLAQKIFELLPDCQGVLVSDYDKGVCTPGLLRLLIGAARALGIPVLVDPVRGADYARYAGATTMTPNRAEAEAATGISVRTPQDGFAAAGRLCQKLSLDAAIITLDSDGMALAWRDGRTEHLPTRPRAVYDITGAGDMVLSMIGLCLASGTSLTDACRLANVAGGLEVEKVGVARVSREEIRADLLRESRAGGSKIVSLDELTPLVDAARQAGRRIVFTNGCFDLLHVGHVTYLAEAASRGDVLIVGVNSDAGVRRLKGPSRPVITEVDRAALLAALACVDHVLIFDDPTPIAAIEKIRPDVLVKGGDYRHNPHDIPGKTFVESYGGELYLTSMVEGVSTTKILKSVA
ncbi:MAG: D-glycero-beta-D-manno-heptose 1-phosphate adenylyltransferase [Pirellulales bacterium]